MDKVLVEAARFGVHADGTDCTRGVRAALQHCLEIGARCLSFAPGTYHFDAERAAESYVFLSNNDEGLRRIVFPLQNFWNFEIDGQGAAFVFRGTVLPFVIEGSRGVTLRRLSVDWDQPFHCEGLVVAADEHQTELEFSEAFPFEVVNGRFQSLGPSAAGWNWWNVLAFDPVRRETAFGAQDHFDAWDKFRVEQTASRRVCLHGRFSEPGPVPGQVLLLTDGRRNCPAVVVSDSADVILEDLTIHHAGGMGVIAQRSENLEITRLRVEACPGSGRLISTTADATHFASCRGRIALTDCTFRTQVDDATNVHGVYTPVTARLDSHTVEVRLAHRQQRGRHPAEPGHRMQFVSGQTLAPLHEAPVAAVRRINSEYTELAFAEPLPEPVGPGSAVLDLFWQPTEIVLRGCTVSGNRARGFLVSVSGRVLIEDCAFHVPGAAVLIEGDANFWFESGPVSDVTIRNNRFVCCNYGPAQWGVAAIQISPAIPEQFRREPRFHRGVRIEGNHFEVFHPTLLEAHSVDGLLFRHNTITVSADYPAERPGAPRCNVRDCSRVEIDGE